MRIPMEEKRAWRPKEGRVEDRSAHGGGDGAGREAQAMVR